MKIIEWKIERYRSIEEGQFELDDFTVLIGKNNSGKSNIIDSLRDFRVNHNSQTERGGIPESWTTKRATGKGEETSIVLSLRFQLSEEERSKVFDTISKAEGDSRRKRSDRLTADGMQREGWISELEYRISYNSDSSIDIDRYIDFEEEDTDLDGLHGKSSIFGANLRNEVNEIAESIGSWVFVDPFREPKDAQTARFREDLDPSGNNLIQVLDSLDQNYGEVFSKIVDAYVDIMEGVSDIRVEYDPEHRDNSGMTIVVEEEGFDTKFRSEDISSGSKEILVLLTQIYLAEKFADVLIIEEPELHIHPEAEKKIFDILQDVVSEGGPQVIVSTHSDVFVDRSDASNIVRVEREGSTEVRTLSEGEIERELTELGYDKSGLLQSEAVVFVEGRSDKRILKKFAKRAGLDLDSEGVAVVELEGIANMLEDAKSLVKLLYSFDIPYLFIRDRHDKPKAEAEGELYEAMKRDDGDHWWEVDQSNIYVWDAYGIESYLLDSEAVSDGLEMDAAKVEEIIEEHSDLEDKGEVLERIYAAEHSELDEADDIYIKDRHGMQIASRIPASDLHDDVQEAILEISDLIDKRDSERLNFEA